MQEMKVTSSSGNDNPPQGVPPKPDIAPPVPSTPIPPEGNPASPSESDKSGQAGEPEQEADEFFKQQTQNSGVDELLRRLSDK